MYYAISNIRSPTVLVHLRSSPNCSQRIDAPLPGLFPGQTVYCKAISLHGLRNHWPLSSEYGCYLLLHHVPMQSCEFLLVAILRSSRRLSAGKDGTGYCYWLVCHCCRGRYDIWDIAYLPDLELTDEQKGEDYCRLSTCRRYYVTYP
jgi:hypothetical protein